MTSAVKQGGTREPRAFSCLPPGRGEVSRSDGEGSRDQGWKTPLRRIRASSPHAHARGEPRKRYFDFSSLTQDDKADTRPWLPPGGKLPPVPQHWWVMRGAPGFCAVRYIAQTATPPILSAQKPGDSLSHQRCALATAPSKREPRSRRRGDPCGRPKRRGL